MSQTTNLGKVCVTPKGTHNPAITYAILDIVTDNGSAYIAKKDVPADIAITNTTYWLLLVAKGGTGEITGATASISGGYGTPGVSVTPGGTATERTFAFAFENLVGNGIVSITSEKTGTSGNVDTYTMTITYDSGDTDTVTYTVTNGSVTSVNGMTGDVVVRDVEHADVADNLSPYSEDSGTTQENPFIAQGTGTDNNSVIVTTGTIARQLEKQGNTIAKNQKVSMLANSAYGLTCTVDADGNASVSGTYDGTSEYRQFALTTGFDILPNHKYWVFKNKSLSHNWGVLGFAPQADTTNYFIHEHNVYFGSNVGLINLVEGETINFSGAKIYVVDLTQWFNGNENIPADLLAHPDHWSWHCNETLTYDAGSLQNCNGRYLECGQGRQMLNPTNMKSGYIDDDGVTIVTGTACYSEDYMLVVPNTSLNIYYIGASGLKMLFYDNNKNLILFSWIGGGTLTIPSNCRYIRLTTDFSYGASYKNDINLSIYYTPQQGGEGYDQVYQYVAPIRIDTGDETLKAFDKKLPSGVITRATNDGITNAKNLNWQFVIDGGYGYAYVVPSDMPAVGKSQGKLICSKLDSRIRTIYIDSAHSLVVTFAGDAFADVTELKNAFDGVAIQYELDEPTTEQGTPFSEYADINDYSYMAWFDEDGNLVSIPQGCKLHYPANYKGFIDDGVMYTDGDFTNLALKEAITDAALAERGYYKMQDLLTTFGANGMVGGTLRQLLAEKATLDFNNTACIDLGSLDWDYDSDYAFFYSRSLYGSIVVSTTAKGNEVLLCSKYKSTTTAGNTPDSEMSTAENITITYHCNGTIPYLYVKDTTFGTDKVAFKNAMNGVLLAFEKAST